MFRNDRLGSGDCALMRLVESTVFMVAIDCMLAELGRSGPNFSACVIDDIELNWATLLLIELCEDMFLPWSVSVSRNGRGLTVVQFLRSRLTTLCTRVLGERMIGLGCMASIELPADS